MYINRKLIKLKKKK